MTEHLLQMNEQLDNTEEAMALFGNQDVYLKLMEEGMGVSIITRGETVYVSGSEKQAVIVDRLLSSLLRLIRKGIDLSERDIVYAMKMAKTDQLTYFESLYDDEITKNAKGKSIRVKTLGQRKYAAAMKEHDMVFGIGPAGTGKTYLAVVKAVHELKNGHVKRIILTRPAVEAGESLGFLPGDLKEKVDPYLRPLYDALHDVLGSDHTERLMERGVIEIAPLAYMRGRTLDDSFVILDEAQNTTPAQMKMFLTRLGFKSKMVITGDITQVDLPKGIKSGLQVAREMLKHIPDIPFVELDPTDVVRHPLVAKIIEAYETKNN
ncbi:MULTISPECIES: PhoH family protein [Bacillus]|uniref:PhoH-like protein n=2 Tax=Bacillus TaxID=1386 RepID=A0A0M3R9M1_9BACI|nr:MULTISPECIES: PhoH family protein [Bacillus]ALC81666.1 phosphate starvation-inducible protein PhoH [Bacillus gobiensis]MBP1080715.1 phosphate starvation-inducible PhoH-like protein [Bacillus capparidis]MED1094571.1 PhoH family protein [Bacillus capparidis]